MKLNKFSIIAVFATIMMFGACADEPLPFETFEDLQKGAVSRILEDDGGSFFFTDADNSNFSFTMEYFDEANGANIAAHEWFVYHRNNVTGEVSAPIMIESVSSFGTNAKSGLPEASFSFSMNEALSTLGLTLDDVNGGDDLIFDGIIVMNDGRRFGPDNTGSNLQGNNGFDGRFRFIKSLLCASSLDGVYDYVGTGWCGTEVSGQMEFVQVGDGVYDIFTTANDGSGGLWKDLSMGAYQACYETTDSANLPNGNVQIKDACNQLSYIGSSQWGEVYTFNSITVNGPVLTIDWKNDYDPEAGVAVITRTDGTDWPSLK